MAATGLESTTTQFINEHSTIQQNWPDTFYEKMRTIAEELNIKLEAEITMKKSEWKRRIKDKVQNEFQERVEKEMESQAKLRTVREDKWGGKVYSNM